ncbi:MAG: ApaLI family restriction endonuclease [Chloroflexota bacterium]
MNIERLSKTDLVAHGDKLGIETKNKQKAELIKAIRNLERQQIDDAILNGFAQDLLKEKIRLLADEYSSSLNKRIAERRHEMQADNNDHYLIYRVLGISNSEGKLIDEYQNTGRFLYKYAGSFLEEAATQCLFFANHDGGKITIPNNQGSRPKTFEIDFLNGNDAVELKWRDATTDGDHITKEHARIRAIESQGYKPIRVMFYKPQREQAKRIQATLATLYNGVGGEYYAGEDAWEYLAEVTGYHLKTILTDIADAN